MSAADPERRDSELRDQLYAAAREEDPPEASLARALELVDEAPAGEGAPARSSRWWLWALPAAAALLGLALLFSFQVTDMGETAIATEPTASPAPSATQIATVAVAVRPALSPSASASASSTAMASNAVAKRPPDKATKASAKPQKKWPATKAGGGKACPCSPGDLMCQMQKCGK